ncbi:MAG: hypothetical protein GEU98_16370 [Pseudonocardiaceae bacterium]|nr:hypothetical protein [Pseudonocardiaceae bacterium]
MTSSLDGVPHRSVLLRPLTPCEPALAPARGRQANVPWPRGTEHRTVRPARRTGHDDVPAVLRVLLTTYLETLHRRRPASQLLGTIPVEAYERTRLRARKAAERNLRYRAGTVRCCWVSDDVLEAAVPVHEYAGHAHEPRRCTALAVRLERTAGRWHCTVFEVL